MHHIYHTDALILGSRNFGEAGKHFFLFTRELGMVYASAQGVRKLSSRLRYVLQDFNYIKVDLVRGKDFWRVTSASKQEELEGLSKKTDTLKVLANLSKLLRRLLAGEEKNGELFSDLISGLKILETRKEKEDIQNAEVLLVLRILYRLGYIGEDGGESGYMASPLAEDLVYEVSKKRREILSQINKALRESHL
jgi:DNA repair protein RecO (recombination protein O)